MEKQLLKRVDKAEQRIVDLYHKLRTIVGLPGPEGPMGPQGEQGIPGTPGAVGPAGLEWKGAWDENTSYVEDDAVGYDGASYFCIAAISGTGNDAPNIDTTHWALLAAQGAQGVQGIQGPIGPQGPSGSVVYTENFLNTTTSSYANIEALLESNYTRVYVDPQVGKNYIALSATGRVAGNFYVVENRSTTSSVIVKLLNGACVNLPTGFVSNSNYKIPPRTVVRFTFIDTTSGSDKIMLDEVILEQEPVKTSFVCALTQSGTGNPSITSVKNNTGRNITFTYDDLGSYLVTISGANILASNIHAWIGDTQFATDFAQVRVINQNSLLITTARFNSGDFSLIDGALNSTPFKIDIYN